MGQAGQLVGRAADWHGDHRAFKVMPDTVGDFLAGEWFIFPRRSDRLQDPCWRAASEPVTGDTAGSRLEQLVCVLISRKEQASDFRRDSFQLFQASRSWLVGEVLADQKQVSGMPGCFPERSRPAGEASNATASSLLVDTPGQRSPKAGIRFSDCDIESRVRSIGGDRWHRPNRGLRMYGSVCPCHRIIGP